MFIGLTFYKLNSTMSGILITWNELQLRDVWNSNLLMFFVINGLRLSQFT